MPRYWLIGSAVALAVLLAASIAIALTRDVVVLPEGSPERAVQVYLKAVSDDDFEAARAVLSSELREQCTLEIMVSQSYQRRGLDDSRVTLKSTSFVGDKAIVVAEVAQISRGGIFGTDEWSRDERYTLVQEEGEWRISASPWPYRGCTMPRPADVQPAPKATPAPAPGVATSTDTTR